MKNLDELHKEPTDRPTNANETGLSDERLQQLENEALLKIINLTSIVSTSDKRGNILELNDKLVEVSQYSREECIGMPHSMFRHPDMPKAVFKEMWGTIGRGNIFRGKVKNKKKDGTPYYVDAVICPILGENGKPVKYLGVRYEITEQEIDRQNMKGIIDAIEQAYSYVEFDIHGSILKANKNFLNAIGYELNEITKHHHSEFIFDDEKNSQEYQNFWSSLAAGKSFNDKFVYRSKLGEEVWFRAAYTPVMDENGRVYKIIKISTDFTEQKKSQEQAVATKVNRILDIVNAAANGDLTKEIIVTDVADPIDRVCAGLKTFFDKLRENISSIADSSKALASSAEELTAVSHQMTGNAAETSTQSNLVSAAAQQVSESIQIVATGAEQLDDSIQEIAKSTAAAAVVANQAVTFAEETSQTMTKLGNSSIEIGNVVKVITSIAEQTNLLALNATIEAARAGESGKGFAVVANEVKELAKETAKATKDISEKIEIIQNDTRNTVSAIGKISSIIGEINHTQTIIAATVEEQSVTAKAIGHNVLDAANSATEISQSILSVARAAQETTEGADNNQLAAAVLSKMALELQKIVSQFIC